MNRKQALAKSRYENSKFSKSKSKPKKKAKQQYVQLDLFEELYSYKADQKLKPTNS